MAHRTAKNPKWTVSQKFEHVWERLDALQETDGNLWLKVDDVRAELDSLLRRDDESADPPGLRGFWRRLYWLFTGV